LKGREGGKGPTRSQGKIKRLKFQGKLAEVEGNRMKDENDAGTCESGKISAYEHGGKRGTFLRRGEMWS